MAQQKKVTKEKAKNMEALNKRYQSRISVAKQGKIAFQNNDFMNAIKFYNMYFKIISDVKEVSDKKINPGLFNKETELSEMMLISHIYWDLAKIYDRTDNLQNEFRRCLSQFAKFTTGHAYQVVNAEMLRRHIRSGRMIHKNDFVETHKKIYVQSKKCYVATHCFGYEHENTHSIRKIKPYLLQSHMGYVFTDLYYKYSPSLVRYLQNNPRVDFVFTRLIAKPVLTLFSKIISRLIMSK